MTKIETITNGNQLTRQTEQALFNYFASEHDVLLLESDLYEIQLILNKRKPKINYNMENLTNEACDLLFQQLPIEKKQVVAAVLLELNKAERKHPEWPADFVHASAIVTEESGELTRAALQHVYKNGEKERMLEEAVQTAAMGIRFAYHQFEK